MKRMMLMGGWMPKGKYSYSELVTMIGTNGYIPVATISEFNSLQNLATQKMGRGTPFEANYLTGTDKKYVQVSNLNFDGFSWSKYTLSGTYDGNLLNISNISMQLFDVLNICENVIIIDGNLTIGSSQNGALLCTSATYLNNIFVYGNITCSNSDNIGGVVCFFENNEIYSNIYSNVDITGNANIIGGVVARQSNSCTSAINNCVYEGTISTSNSTSDLCGYGGIIGWVGNYSYMTVEKCKSNCTIIYSGNSSYVQPIGGIIGNIYSPYESYIYKCSFTGSINVTNSSTNLVRAGGIWGIASIRTTGIASNNYVKASFSGSGSNILLSGFAYQLRGTVNNFYSASTFTGDGTKNSIANSGTITASYYDSTLATSIIGTGKTTTEMQAGLIPDTSIYVGWDDTIWQPNSSSEYPTLINT